MAYLRDTGFRGGGWNSIKNYLALEEQGELIVAGGAHYLRLPVGDRLELWTRIIDGKPDVLVHSFYRGDTRFPVALVGREERKSRLFGDGAFLCRTKPYEGDGWIAGQIPFVFDVHDYHRYDRLSLPCCAVAQLTASALSLVCYADEDEYDEANPPDEKGYGWQPRHFVPAYAFEPRDEDGELQRGGGIISGYVLDTAILTNPLTGLDFCWARIESICGEVDVVCSPDDLSGYLHSGGIATANCSLAGRIVGVDDEL